LASLSSRCTAGSSKEALAGSTSRLELTEGNSLSKSSGIFVLAFTNFKDRLFVSFGQGVKKAASLPGRLG
jgi:hypothetical protein